MTPTTQFVRDSLNIKSSDFFASYGMGPTARGIVDECRALAEVSAGIALDTVEYEESSSLRTVVYQGLKEFGAQRLFDKVYCDYTRVPKSQREPAKVLGSCYELCTEKGMVLVEGLHSMSDAKRFLNAKHITKYWMLRPSISRFDLLYIKERHFE